MSIDSFFSPGGLLSLAAVGSVVLTITAFAPYLYYTLKGETRPQRACWFIWSILSAISFAGQLYEGATLSLGFAAAQVTGTSMVFLLSIRYGYGPLLTRWDSLALLGAGAGLWFWYQTESGAYALATTITISMLGGLLTVFKAYQVPRTETLTKWAVNMVAASLAALSVGALDWVLLAYPLYLLTLNGLIVAAILRGHHHARVRAEAFARARETAAVECSPKEAPLRLTEPLAQATPPVPAVVPVAKGPAAAA